MDIDRACASRVLENRPNQGVGVEYRSSLAGVISSDTLTTDGETFQLLHTFDATHHDGKNPYGSLLLVGDQFYGTTAEGGDNDMGTVFTIDTDGSDYQRLYSFGGTANNGDGAKPIDNVILVNGSLYGMTTEGGAHDLGAVFKVPVQQGASRLERR